MEKPSKKSLANRIFNHWEFYLMLFPAVVLVFIFKYVPMYGLQLAFKDYNAAIGINASEWVGFEHFIDFFSSYSSSRIIWNTIILSLQSIIFTFPIPIILSFMLNQVHRTGFKKTVQTVIYAPYFISVMVVAGMLTNFLSPSGGLINLIIEALGGEAVYFLGDPDWFRPVYIISSIWQTTGWGTIIYIAALSSVDPSLYDSAKVDGAGVLKRIIHIDFPTILPTIIIMLIMSFGSLMNVGFDKVFLLQTDLNIETSDVIATYIYNQGILKTNYSISTAVGLFNTAINIVLLLVVNKIAQKASDVSFI